MRLQVCEDLAFIHLRCLPTGSWASTLDYFIPGFRDLRPAHFPVFHTLMTQAQASSSFSFLIWLQIIIYGKINWPV